MTRLIDFSLDRHRPTLYFLPPANWMNDPNGLVQWKGTYHLFYQYNPNGVFWGTMRWGHVMSKDLVHWTHMRVAFTLSPDGPDADGCDFGCAVDVDGVATLIYTGVRGEDELPCVAMCQNDDPSTWQKHMSNLVIAAPPAELDTTIFWSGPRAESGITSSDQASNAPDSLGVKLSGIDVSSVIDHVDIWSMSAHT